MDTKADIIIVGAGACGLMAARELAKAGKKVLILEARDRIGGRIYPLDEKEWGYPAQGGAEFVHGDAPITHMLIKEAGLVYITIDPETWLIRDGSAEEVRGVVEGEEKTILHEKLAALKEDIPIAKFLDENFQGEEYLPMRKSIIRMVENYDAAEPTKISTFSLREEWLSDHEWKQGRIKEGYGPLLNFLETDAKQQGASIILNTTVCVIEVQGENIIVKTNGGEVYEVGRVIFTGALPTYKNINFMPAIPEKITEAEKIGFGPAMKVILKFKERWWLHAANKDLEKTDFMRTVGNVAVWWTQNPDPMPVLVGWIAGPRAKELSETTDQEILNIALGNLAEAFKKSQDEIESKLILGRVFNWPKDPLALGAYSYSTPESEAAYAELRKPIANKIFFAGEALCLGNESATVEGALASGKEVAAKILNQ